MRNTRSSRIFMLLGGAVLLTLATVPASAQDSEDIIVSAPRVHDDTDNARNGLLEKVSMSKPVRTDDLDLSTRRGAFMLRRRVRFEARDVCRHLAGLYPVYQAPGTSCYRSALESGMLSANRAISDARSRGYDD